MSTNPFTPTFGTSSRLLVGRRRQPGRLPAGPVDRTFLAAMAHDDGLSWMADIAARLGVDTAYAGQCGLRLIAAEVIEPRRDGRVDFTLPRTAGLHDTLAVARARAVVNAVPGAVAGASRRVSLIEAVKRWSARTWPGRI